MVNINCYNIGDKVIVKNRFQNDTRTEIEAVIRGIELEDNTNDVKYKIHCEPDDFDKKLGATGCVGYVNHDDILRLYHEKQNMNNRKFVYAFINVHRTISIVNYDATNNRVNTFLSLFDGWGSDGEFKISIDGDHQEVWFECFCETMDLFKTPLFREAFKRMGVELVFEYPYV